MEPLCICSSCRSFAPRGATACPHCAEPIAGPSSPLARLGLRVLAVAGGGVIATTLMACYGPPPRPTEPTAGTTTTQGCAAGSDQDGDGSCAPADCDDTSPAVFPGAPDSAGDGIDQNCDGAD